MLYHSKVLFFLCSSKWNTNEFFQGAYSFRSVDGDKVIGDICGHLSDPIVVADEERRNVGLLCTCTEVIKLVMVILVIHFLIKFLLF